jgi:hypothetical protein
MKKLITLFLSLFMAITPSDIFCHFAFIVACDTKDNLSQAQYWYMANQDPTPLAFTSLCTSVLHYAQRWVTNNNKPWTVSDHSVEQVGGNDFHIPHGVFVILKGRSDDVNCWRQVYGIGVHPNNAQIAYGRALTNMAHFNFRGVIQSNAISVDKSGSF